MVSRFLLQLFLCLSFLTPAAAITGPSVPTKTPAGCPSAFGLKDICNLRGGEVIDGSSASLVDSIINEANSEDVLVVIDFSATWYELFFR